VGVDMRNVERKGADQPLHPFISVFRTGLGAVLGNADLKSEMVRALFFSQNCKACTHAPPGN
jgi:hypothetical protein